MGECRLLTFLVNCQKLKKKKCYGTLKFFLTKDHVGLPILKCYSSNFHPISFKLCEDISCHGKYRLLRFLAIGQLLKLCGTFKC